MHRALLLSYLHDCCHCIYFALPPSYQPREVNVFLPCENKLWNAKTANEWWAILQEESPYGYSHTRLVGQNLLQMVDLISETRVLTSPIALSPFAHFILAHSILRHLFTICSESRLQQNDAIVANSETIEQQIYVIEFALHNWFRSWTECPEKIKPKNDEEPPFMQNGEKYLLDLYYAHLNFQHCRFSGWDKLRSWHTRKTYRRLRTQTTYGVTRDSRRSRNGLDTFGNS